jgi:hypothetical protein
VLLLSLPGSRTDDSFEATRGSATGGMPLFLDSIVGHGDLNLGSHGPDPRSGNSLQQVARFVVIKAL